MTRYGVYTTLRVTTKQAANLSERVLIGTNAIAMVYCASLGDDGFKQTARALEPRMKPRSYKTFRSLLPAFAAAGLLLAGLAKPI